MLRQVRADESPRSDKESVEAATSPATPAASLNGVRIAADPLTPGEKPGKQQPGGKLWSPNGYVAMVPLNLSGERVPTQQEVSGQGAMCGGLAPAAPAEPQVVEDEVDKILRKEGFGQGLNTKFPTPEQAQALVTRRAATPKLLAAAKRLDEGKKKVRKARKQNRDFALAMLKWNDTNFRGADKALRAYVKEFEDSPWTPEALIHIADLAKFNGQLAEAELGYQKVLAMTSSDTGEMSYESHLKAYERWADLYLLEGRFGEARPMLENIVRDDVHWRRRTWALYWTMQLNALFADPKVRLADLDCGTQALAALLVDLGRSQQARRVAALDPKTEKGFSLADLKTIAGREKVEMVGFRATPAELAEMTLPAILHFSPSPSARAENAKVTRNTQKAPLVYGHYVVVRAHDANRGLWSVLNPQDGTSYTLDAAQLGKEWSGAGLMLAKSPPEKVLSPAQERTRWLALWPRTGTDKNDGNAAKTEPVTVAAAENPQSASKLIASKVIAQLSAAEMRRTFGTCYVVHANSQNGGRSFKVTACDGGGCGSYGEPGVAIDPVDQNIFITDTPVWYNPAKGPKLELNMAYNSLLASNYNDVLGNKWTHNYSAFLTEMTNQVTHFGGDGSQDVYIRNNNGSYTAPNGVYDKLVKTGTHTYYLESQEGDREFYGIPAGQNSTVPMLLQQRDRRGYSLTIDYWLYQGKVLPRTITDADGNTARFVYSDGKLYTVIMPDGRRATFSYDYNGNLSQCTDAAGQRFYYSYDSMIMLTQLDKPQGSWKFVSEIQSYNGGNSGYNQIKVYDPLDTNLSSPMIVRYDNAVHGQAHYTSTDHRGATTSYGVQSVGGIGVVNRITTPEGYTQSVAFDSADPYQPVATGDPYTNSTLQYNPQGNLLRKSMRINGNNYARRTLGIGYSGNGLDATSAAIEAQLGDTILIQELGSAPSYSRHQPTRVYDAANNRTDISYTGWGAPSSITTYDGTSVQDNFSYVYGTQSGPDRDRLVRVVRNNRLQAAFTYDASGRVATMSDARGLTVRYFYDNLDNLTQTVYPDNTTETIEYLWSSLPTRVTDRSGRITTYRYDSLKRLTSMTDADNQTLIFGYDKEGNRTSLRDARGAETLWQYDGDGRATRKTYADATYEGWSYNGATARLTGSRNARGQTTTYDFDAWGQPRHIDYPTTSDVTLGHDRFGRLNSMSDGVGNTTWSYDRAGRPSVENGPWNGDEVQHFYNSRNDISRVEVGSNVGKDVVNYGYDRLGRLDQVSASTGKWGNVSGVGGGVWNTNYLGSTSLPSSSSAPNGMFTVWSYEATDKLGRLTGVSNRTAVRGGVLSKFDYLYRGNAFDSIPLDARNIVGKQYGNSTGQSQNIDHRYNATSMLVSEAGTTAGNASTPQIYKTYGYDAMGNRTEFSDYYADQLTARSTYNRLNQIEQTTLSNNRLVGYSYDGDGNTTGSFTSTPGSNSLPISVFYGYDDANRLTSISSSSSRYQFVYDGLSRLRISRYYVRDANDVLVLQNEKHRVYDGMDVVQERASDNVVTASLTRAGNIGGILARTTDAGHVFYGYDGSGNVVTLTNSSGAEVGSYTYDAWGNTAATSGAAAGENPYRFSTKEQIGGLYSYGFRFYSPGLGRWMSRDPIGESGGTNLYAFVGNDPVNMVDDYGMVPNHVSVAVQTSTRAGWAGFFSRDTVSHLTEDVEKGWYPAADGLNPLGDPYYDMGYWSNCDSTSNASFGLGQVSQQALFTAATGGSGAGARQFLGRKLFLHPKFGVASARFGNSASGVQGSLNVPGRLFKIGWSSTGAHGGGWAFRVGVGAKAGSNAARFHPIQWPFVNNGFGNGAAATQKSLLNLNRSTRSTMGFARPRGKIKP